MPLYAWIAIAIVALGALAAWALCRINRKDVCPDPYDAQADVFPRYSDGHDGPGGVVTWKRARAADTEGGEA